MDTKTVNYHGTILTPEFKILVKSLITERDGDLCHRCKNNKAKEIHHLAYDELPKLNDLIMLCHECHIDITIEGRGQQRRKGMTPAEIKRAQRQEKKLRH